MIERFARVATFIFVKVSENSSEGNFIVDFEDVEKFFGFKMNKFLFDKVVHFLYQKFSDQVLDVADSYEEGHFDITIGTDYTLHNTDSNSTYDLEFDSETEFEFEEGKEPVFFVSTNSKIVKRIILGYNEHSEELEICIPSGSSYKVVATLSDCPKGDLTEDEYLNKYIPIAEEVLNSLGYTVTKEIDSTEVE